MRLNLQKTSILLEMEQILENQARMDKANKDISHAVTPEDAAIMGRGATNAGIYDNNISDKNAFLNITRSPHFGEINAAATRSQISQMNDPELQAFAGKHYTDLGTYEPNATLASMTNKAILNNIDKGPEITAMMGKMATDNGIYDQ